MLLAHIAKIKLALMRQLSARFRQQTCQYLATYTSASGRDMSLYGSHLLFCSMITLYGIRNCDIMQKAFKWLDAKGLPYRFHDYRAHGLDKATIEHWLEHLPLAKLLNSRSTTFRELPEADKAGATDKARAIALMLEHNSIIKRPVWDLGKGRFFLGWDEKEISKLV